MESLPLVDYVLSPKCSLANKDQMSQSTTDFPPVSDQEHSSPEVSFLGHEQFFPSSSLTRYDEDATAAEWTPEAMVHSSLAANQMQQQQYDQALVSYQQALRMYRRDYLKGGVVDKCNAAATLHNMGLLHKKSKRYHQAIACLKEAEVLYRECSSQTQPQKRGQGVCLEYLLAETLQNRANLHSKYHRNVAAAIECQEEVVTMLLDLGYSPQRQENKKLVITPKITAGENVVYVRITDDQKVHLLSISLRSLGNLYLQQGEQDDALGAYQEAVDMLRCRQAKHPDLNLQKKIASILLSMACVYFAQNELDQAVVALDECIAIHGGDQTHPDVITALNNLGLAYERKGDLDMAMQCYEDMLELKRRQLGENHVQVAEALITVAKMLERQGNMTGALERYQESLEIYRGALSNEDQSFGRNVAEVLSKISSLSNERASVEDAVNAYQQALITRNSKTGETALDEAKVFLGLAGSFSRKQSFQAAKDCLTETRQLLRSLPQDSDQVVELNLQILTLESSIKAEVPQEKYTCELLLLSNQLANLESVVEEISEDAAAEATQNLAKESAVQIIEESGEESDIQVVEKFAEATLMRVLPEESTIAFPDVSGEYSKASIEDAESPNPMLLLPLAGSHESLTVGPDDEGEDSSLAHLLQQITVTDETESAIELQCIVLGETKSIESASVSTRSVTPESSLEELSPPLDNSQRSLTHLKENELPTTHSPISELRHSVLELPYVGEISSVPEDVDPYNTIFDEELSFTFPTASSVPSEAVASSIGLNTYSSELGSEQLDNPLHSNMLASHVSSISNSDHMQLDASRHMEKPWSLEKSDVHPTASYEGDPDLEYDVLEDDEYRESNLNQHYPHRAKSDFEYDSFGESSMLETDSEDGDSNSSDYEGAHLEFESKEGEESDAREDIYWDEEENCELQPTRTQEFDHYAFETPLGLKEKSVGASTNDNMGTTKQADGPRTVGEHHRMSPVLKKSRSNLSSPQKNLAPDVDPKKSPRHRLAKALSRPFRRRSSQISHKLDPTPEDEVAKINHNALTTAQRHLDFNKAGPEDELSSAEYTRPIDYIKMGSVSYDDSVSQITFHQEDFLSRSNEGSQQWSWGLNVFADIAEDFLSAKSIHNKNRKAEENETYSTSSGEESDPFEDLSEKETLETKTDVNSDNAKGLVGLSIAITGESDVQDESISHQLTKTAPGPNVEGIVQDVNSAMWKPPSMLSLSTRRRNGSPKIQIRIDSLERTLEVQKGELGYFHETIATSLVRLALLRAENGDTDTAIESMLEALRIQKELRDPQSMAQSLHLLADIYCRQEQYELALRVYNDVQRIERRLCGPDHPVNANTLNKIGRVYANQGSFYQAMEKHQQALQVLKACFGEHLSHPAVSETLIHIGEVYYRERNSLSTIRNNADDYKKFIATGMLDIISRAHENRGSYKIALGFLEEKLQLIKNENNDFPKGQLARILYNVGTLSCKSGVFLEAIDYYEQALDIQVRLGCNEVDVATAKVLIGTVEYHLGQYRKSLNLLEGALTLFERQFGLEHEAVADTLHRIGIVKAVLWNHDDAMDNLERALKIQLKLFGENDLEVLNTRLGICWIEMNEGATNVALRIREIMQKQQNLVGEAHPIIADTLLLLGKVYLLAGNGSKAVQILQDSFNMREQFLGRDHPHQAETFHLIALEGIRREKFQYALSMCHSVLGIRRETLGERHLDVATTLSSMGRCYAGTGKFVEAFRLFDEALQIAQESVGENHPCVGDIYVAKGSLYLRKCQFRSAKEMSEKGIEIYKTADMSRHHIRMKESTKLLEKIVRDEMLCV